MPVFLTDANSVTLEHAIGQIRRNLTNGVEPGYLQPARLLQSLARIQMTADMAEAVAITDFIIEAVYEDMAVKHRVCMGSKRNLDGETLWETIALLVSTPLLAQVLIVIVKGDRDVILLRMQDQ